MIEHVSFGKLVFNGKVSRSDTIVYKDHIDSRWWINSRTSIEPEDLKDVIKEEPEIVIICLGFMMPIKISDDAVNALKAKHIEVIIEDPEKAADLFNEFASKKKTIGLFHLL